MDMKPMERAISRLSAHSTWDGARNCRIGVTIAIPNWNHEYLLPRSIASALEAVRLLSQYDVPAEVLVIDDQSRDGSLVLLRQLEALYCQDGLRIMALARNGGLPAARNNALQHATYRYIVFMDADNELVPGNIHQFFRSIVETEAAVVYGNLISRGGASDEQSLVSNESFQYRAFLENYIDAFALVDRLQIFDSGGYLNTVEVEAREDWELYLHLAATGRRIIFVPLIFGIYYRLAHSMLRDAGASHEAQQIHMRRVFDQMGIRERLTFNTRHLRYHPDIGYF
jgi:glycosyltransferase involved in cell wall biosynthesis